MKKIIVMILMLFMMVACGSTANNGAAQSDNDKEKKITLAEAKKIALVDANVSENDVVFTKEEQNDEGMFSLLFTSGGAEYEYRLNNQGSIVSRGPLADTDSDGASAKDISLEDAQNIAFNHTKEPLGTFSMIKAEIDYENGIKVYDLEFWTNEYIYEYEIEVSSGKIISHKSKVNEMYIADSTEIISVGQVKSIALQHAGMTANQVRFTKIKLDYENGVQVYDVDFIANGREYEFEIRASDGKVLEFSIDD